MTYLSDFMDAERHADPEKFDAAMDRVWFRHRMELIRTATLDLSKAVEEAAKRLDEIFA